jgi:hypothetical protein
MYLSLALATALPIENRMKTDKSFTYQYTL